MTKQSKYWVWILVLLPALIGFAVDVYTPSLPVITKFLGATHSQGKLTIAVFTFGFGFGQLFIGPLSDRLGRKAVLSTGLLLFTLASLAASFAHSLAFFLAMRLLQGLSAAGHANVRAIVADSFADHDLQRIMAYLVMSWTLSPVIGPVIGGYLQTYFGWQSCFYFLAGYALLLFILVVIFLPETHHKRTSMHIKKLVANYSQIAKSGFFLRNVLCLGLLFAVINVFNVLGPFIIQIDLNYSPLFYAHLALLIGVVGFLGGLANRFLMRRYPAEKVIRLALVLLLVVSIVSFLIAFEMKLNLWIVVMPAALTLFIDVLIYPYFTANCASRFRHIAGTASAYRGVVSIVLASAVIALMSKIHINSILIYTGIYTVLSLIISLVALDTLRIARDHVVS